MKVCDKVCDEDQDGGRVEMKITDDYRAKIRLWVANPTVTPAPPPPALPKFAPKKFSNHEEMNRWKAELLRQLARDIAPNG